MGQWLSIEINAPNAGWIEGTAEYLDAGYEMFEAVQYAMANRLPFDVAGYRALIDSCKVTVKMVDATTYGAANQTYLPSSRILELRFRVVP
jgi:hypothetical protein